MAARFSGSFGRPGPACFGGMTVLLLRMLGMA